MPPSHRPVRALALSLALGATGAVGVPGAVAVAAPAARTATAAAAGLPTLAAAIRAAVPAAPAGSPAPVGGPQLSRPGVIVNLAPGVPAPPAVPARAWVLADMTTGTIVAARAPHARLLPASTLKTLTALTLIPTVPADRRIVATDADVRADGTRVGMLTGSSYTAGQLFQGLLMASGNDAAYALARVGGGAGGVRQTLRAMNARAAQLGAFDTVARDPAGLDRPGQSSSPYDLALIGRAAMQLPDFRRYVTTKSTSFPGGKGPDGKARRAFLINNHNRLLYNYPGTIGIKNGYTLAAKQTFIGAASRGGHTYLVTEMAGTNGSWRPTAALLDWAFAHGAHVAPVGRLVQPGSVPRPAGSAAGGAAPSDPRDPSADAGRAPDPGAGGDTSAPPAGAGPRVAAASTTTTPPAPRPWVGGAGLGAAALLVALLASRPLLRRRQQSRPHKSRPFA
jgi:serine-type D-Ala-D-Ala carboxypeptidase (penicillin-binding protein 5/6)